MSQKRGRLSNAVDPLYSFHQLSELSNKVVKRFEEDPSSLNLVNPSHLRALTSDFERIMAMFDARNRSMREATLCSLADDVLFIIYDALGSDRKAKASLRATCTQFYQALAIAKQRTRMVFYNRQQLRAFTNMVSNFNYADAIQEMDITWKCAHALHHADSFRAFSSLCKVRIRHFTPMAKALKADDDGRVLQRTTLPPLSVFFAHHTHETVFLVHLRTLFARQIDEVSGFVPEDFVLDSRFPLKKLTLSVATYESIFNAGGYVTERVTYSPLRLGVETKIQPSLRPVTTKPVLGIDIFTAERMRYQYLKRNYSGFDFGFIRDPVREAAWMSQ